MPLTPVVRVALALTVLGSAWGHASQQAGAAPPPPAQSDPNVAPTTTGTAAISGVAVDGTAGQPLAGVVIYLGPPSHGPQGQSIRQVTDAKGRFVFAQLPVWDGYFINASKAGYFEGHYGRSSSGQLGARIAVADGQWVRDIRVVMNRAGAITGTVLDDQNQPIVGAYVRVLAQLSVAGESQLVAGTVATTDDRGVYRIAGLTAGKYYVEVPSVQYSVPASTPTATLAGLPPQSVAAAEGAGRPPTFADPIVDADAQNDLILGKYPIPPRSPNGRAMVYPPTFYPSAVTIAAATPVVLKPGEDHAGADLRLAAVAAARLSGVVDGPAESYSGLTLRLMLPGAEDLGEGGEAATALVGEGGHFTFLNVAAGSYVIDASRTMAEFQVSNVIGASSSLGRTPGFVSTGGGFFGLTTVEGLRMNYRSGNGDAGYWVRQKVSVEGRDVSDVVVTMRKGATISGRALWEGQRSSMAPSANMELLDAQPAHGTAALGVVRSQSDKATPDQFRIEGLLPGEYVLRVLFDRVKSIVCGGRDYTYVPFDMSSGADISDCVVTFTDKNIMIDGTVRDGSGQGVGDAAVTVFPVEREQWGVYGFGPARMKSLQVTTAGRFRFQSLPEGDYYFIAVPGDLIDAWKNPDFLEVAATQATRVHLAWGDKVTQDLTVKMIKWDVRGPL